jgi:hypothetical protein
MPSIPTLPVWLCQVGNAVPPPLAAALGRQLRKVLEEKKKKELAATLAAQFD